MSAGTVKMEQEAVEEEILGLLATCPGGVGDDILIGRLPGVEPRLRAQAINKLLTSAKIDLFKQGKEGLLYRLKAPSKATSIAGDQEEKIVYGIVEKAGNLGSWIRDIRGQSNLGQTQLAKVLKTLEGKKLIKVVKTVNNTKKKVYMLYNLEPDHSVTGGAWYSEQDFESEFVEILNQQCFRYLEHQLTKSRSTAAAAGPIAAKNASMCSPADLTKYIGELGISKVVLKEKDIEDILDTIVADGKAEKCESLEGSRLYRAVVPLLEAAGLSRWVPCLLVPLHLSIPVYTV
jgi:DNA-directed RNA polymerase III subunit RPC6